MGAALASQPTVPVVAAAGPIQIRVAICLGTASPKHPGDSCWDKLWDKQLERSKENLEKVFGCLTFWNTPPCPSLEAGAGAPERTSEGETLSAQMKRCRIQDALIPQKGHTRLILWLKMITCEKLFSDFVCCKIANITRKFREMIFLSGSYFGNIFVSECIVSKENILKRGEQHQTNKGIQAAVLFIKFLCSKTILLI